MTHIEIEKMMADRVIEMQKECESRIATLPADAKTEKKALMIENGMYSLCLRAGLLYCTTNERGHTIEVKSTRMPRYCEPYPALAERFAAANTEEKLNMTAALFGEIGLISEILINYRKELTAAKAANDVKSVFELNIKIKAVERVLDDWKACRKKNGLYVDLI